MESALLAVKAYADFVALCWCLCYLFIKNNSMASLQWKQFLWLVGVVNSLVRTLLVCSDLTYA